MLTGSFPPLSTGPLRSARGPRRQETGEGGAHLRYKGGEAAGLSSSQHHRELPEALNTANTTGRQTQTKMRAIVMLCLLGAALAQDQNQNQNRYSWNGPNGNGKEVETGTDNVCLMDKSACGCCLMQRQMTRMETFFNTTMQELQANLQRAQAALRNLRASRSAFSVALTDVRTCVGPFREETVIKYQHVFTNLGSNYVVSTGVYTAPRSGVYNLALTAYSDAGSPGATLAACVRLRINGTPHAAPNERNMQDQEDSASVTMAVQLSAGDQVDVVLPTGCFLCDDEQHHNLFSGFLLYPTD
ncbi:uncharacterized protein LOC134454837 [Engraulis encrasicolus]|uniref:uncharacterized protein LOC134454837 n=1 Tax=Engraulis encrasicolus TaxID=184585 RepID=UPI002FD0FC5A